MISRQLGPQSPRKPLATLLRASSRPETRRGGHAEFRIIIIIIYLLMVYKLYSYLIIIANVW